MLFLRVFMSFRMWDAGDVEEDEEFLKLVRNDEQFMRVAAEVSTDQPWTGLTEKLGRP